MGEGDLISKTKNTVATGLRRKGQYQTCWLREDVLAFIDPVKMTTCFTLMQYLNTWCSVPSCSARRHL